jgi:GNAT superfamily N-acetyltransferase
VDQLGKAFHIRPAIPADAPALSILIDSSVRGLQKHDYSPLQIEGALGTVFGMDTQLNADGTYFVLEAARGGKKTIVGCGGWSKRKTLFGSDHAASREEGLLDPLCENAKIRAFFVHPEWARQGIGSQILQACENAARDAGFHGFELGATVTGERLYRQRGYQVIDRIDVPLPNGASIPIIRMSKNAHPVARQI